MTVVYHGHRDHSEGKTIVLRIDSATGPEPLDWSLDVRNHSPTGLEWGYGGSGPAQLALALCCDVLQYDDYAQHVYHHFKWKVIAGLDREDWTLTEEEIRATIETIEREIGPFVPSVSCPIHGVSYSIDDLCPICIGEEQEPHDE